MSRRLMKTFLERRCTLTVLSSLAVLAAVNGAAAQEAASEREEPAFVSPQVPHPGSDQIWWVPTFAQAQEAAQATGRLILVMGSVSDWQDGY